MPSEPTPSEERKARAAAGTVGCMWIPAAIMVLAIVLALLYLAFGYLFSGGGG